MRERVIGQERERGFEGVTDEEGLNEMEKGTERRTDEREWVGGLRKDGLGRGLEGKRVMGKIKGGD